MSKAFGQRIDLPDGQNNRFAFLGTTDNEGSLLHLHTDDFGLPHVHAHGTADEPHAHESYPDANEDIGGMK